jgi:NADH-quinone oxidoreductase subunit N
MVFAVLAAGGMILGNIIAIQQTNIKRMLAYSSIAHSGYIMIGLAAVGLSPAVALQTQSSLMFYVAAFAITDLAAFTAVIAISSKLNSDRIADYSGVSKRSPLLASALTISLISLIGLPPTAGFIAKFYIFTGAVSSGLLWLVIVAVITSVISAYYYLRVVKVMWLGEPATDESRVPTSGALKLALAASSLGVLVLGVAPFLLIRLAEMATIP